MKINQSIAGSLGAGGLHGAQGAKPAKLEAGVEPVKPAKKPTLQSASLQSSSAPVEAGSVSEFLKQESSVITENAVQGLSDKPSLGKVEINQFKPVEIEAPKGDEAISKLKQSVNQDILIAMANSGSILS